MEFIVELMIRHLEEFKNENKIELCEKMVNLWNNFSIRNCYFICLMMVGVVIWVEKDD